MKTVTLATLCFFLMAFSAKSQVLFSLNAGPNYGNIKSTYDGESDGTKSALGFIGAAYAHIPLAEQLQLLTGLEYESVRAKLKLSEREDIGGGMYYKMDVDFKGSLDFVNIPLILGYKPSEALFIGAGPFLGIGVGGKAKGTVKSEFFDGNTSTIDEESFSEKVKFGDGEDETKRMLLGVGLKFAYQLPSSIRLGAYTNIGLNNLSNEEDVKTKTFSAGITIGYVFGNK